MLKARRRSRRMKTAVLLFRNFSRSMLQCVLGLVQFQPSLFWISPLNRDEIKISLPCLTIPNQFPRQFQSPRPHVLPPRFPNILLNRPVLAIRSRGSASDVWFPAESCSWFSLSASALVLS